MANGRLIPHYSCGSSLIRDSQRFLSTSSTARFDSGPDYTYKTAGAARQTDSETRGEARGSGQAVSALFMQRIVLQREAPDSPPADWCGFISRGCGSSD